ncbi:MULTISPECIES: Ail/Lom family outer membrane beta-barrel protein [Leclercia]|uniref:Ail/Lom family outer membrane beta-barrel protein n=1 Tax=Leclercia TaxID=83654 RepID=UPI000CD08684|nr:MULTISPECIES: Ail/Lom family outer membrane beta-barrel protein [Leclercia]AUU83311.1 Ail/Lom family protein [Leclercia sp. LSNIH1]POV32434.1 Ail/Lom family protein [Leclercia sp. LSNIH5]POW62595.1 Ail/Lom family protein [Leclercia sp. LSNIH2]UYM53842.1 Ail/Lom family outer membrane beta-barrel protein [Leclercia adecarboxylata]
MNKSALVILLAASLTSSLAFANHHTFSLGYAHSDVKDFDNLNGVNVQYRYEFDSPIGLLGSFTWMKTHTKQDYLATRDIVHNDIDVNYYSLLAGPAYRINDYVSLYALGGTAWVKASGNTRWVNYGHNEVHHDGISERSASFAWGVGMVMNPVDNLSINLGYEGTKASMDRDYSINGFNVGMGYRF